MDWAGDLLRAASPFIQEVHITWTDSLDQCRVTFEEFSKEHKLQALYEIRDNKPPFTSWKLSDVQSTFPLDDYAVIELLLATHDYVGVLGEIYTFCVSPLWFLHGAKRSPSTIARTQSYLPHYQKMYETLISLNMFPEHKHAAYRRGMGQLTIGSANGYVYILRSASGHYKIGRSVQPHDRIKTFTVKLPLEVEYEFLIPSSDYAGLEKELHNRFSGKHVNGEWFDLDVSDIAWIAANYPTVNEEDIP